MATRFEVRNMGKPFDGDYPMVAQAELTTLEWSWLREFSGYLPTTLDEGLVGFDPTLVVSLALISMVRAEKVRRPEIRSAWERLADVAFDSAKDDVPTVRFVIDPDEVEADAAEGGADPTEESSTTEP